MRQFLFLGFSFILLTFSVVRAQVGDEGAGAMEFLPEAQPTEQTEKLHNLLKISGKLYSGGEPAGKQSFEALRELGIKTVVSVDGAKPDVELAKAYGLRYVHIPIGYDGISSEAGKSFARLAREAEGPIYVHCHHGTHRGPAAAAVVCVASEQVDSKSALEILRRAGTGENYQGLWRDVGNFTPPPADAELPELVEVAPIRSMAAAMANVDRASDNLKLCQKADWNTPADHPDLSPSQEALLMREGLQESLRQLAEENAYDDVFGQWMATAHQTALELETALKEKQQSRATELFSALQGQCKQCHTAYRD